MTKKGTERTPQEEFYAIYEPLRVKYQLQSHIKGSIYESEEDFIEVHEGYGKDKKLLFKARGELTDCYKQAALNLMMYAEKKAKEKRAREALKFL